MANEQLSPLPPVSTHITGHNSAGKAVIHATRPATWKAFDDNTMAFNQIYTTDFPADLNENRDIVAHDRVIKEGNLGLVKAGGTVCRQVDFAPTYECMMHRTQSLDYGIVTEGSVIMVLDDGSRTLMRRGDVAVQRGTMHAWQNASQTEWARMTFILQDVQPLIVGGQRFGEDLGRGTEGLAASGNDV